MMIKFVFAVTTLALCATGCHRKHAQASATDPPVATPNVVVVVPGPTVTPIEPEPPAAAVVAQAPAPAPAPTTIVIQPSTPPAPAQTIAPTNAGSSVQLQATDAGTADGEHFSQVGDDTRGSGVENP